MPTFTTITPAQLMRLIGTPDCPILIDVRTDDDFDADPRLIPTSFRHPFKNILALAPRLHGRKTVVICHKGLKLSHGAAALLRTGGIDAESVEGGNLAWSAANLPLVPFVAIPAPVDGVTLWVTRHRPKIDRIACPWLIRRFVDPAARFLFVPPSEVLNVADRFGATPFDVEDVQFSHRGDLCTFDTMIAEFGLAHDALDQLATVVRAADTDTHDQSPQAAGLLALSVGLSRMFKDDLAQLEVGITLYDALYRWARDGQGEGHDWPAGRKQ